MRGDLAPRSDPTWRKRRLGEVVESAVDGPFGSNLKTEHYVSAPGVRVVRLQNIGTGAFDDGDAAWVSEAHARRLNRHDVRPGDVLVASLGDESHPVARACLYPASAAPGIVKADCFRLRVDVRQAVPGFLMRLFNCPSTRNGIGGLSQGVTRDRINLGNLLRLTVRVPSVHHQERITQILDTLDAAILKTEQIIGKLRQIQQGLTNDLLTTGIGEKGQLRAFKHGAEPRLKSQAGPFPAGWHPEKLLNMVTLPSGQCDPRIEPFSSRVLVAPDHVESGTGRLLERRTAKDQRAISGKYVFEPGDVVYSKIRPYLRKAILADFHGICSADMYPLRPGADLEPRYLLALVLGEHFSRFAEAVSMRSGFPKINREELAEYVAPFPPLPEQEMIAAVLNTLDSRQEAERRALDKLRAIKSGLVDDLLTGRVPVAIPEAAA